MGQVRHLKGDVAAAGGAIALERQPDDCLGRLAGQYGMPTASCRRDCGTGNGQHRGTDDERSHVSMLRGIYASSGVVERGLSSKCGCVSLRSRPLMALASTRLVIAPAVECRNSDSGACEDSASRKSLRDVMYTLPTCHWTVRTLRTLAPIATARDSTRRRAACRDASSRVMTRRPSGHSYRPAR